MSTSYDLVVTFLALLEMAKMRLASIYQTDHEEPIYLEYTLLDATGDPIVPADVQQPTSDVVDTDIDLSEPVGPGRGAKRIGGRAGRHLRGVRMERGRARAMTQADVQTDNGVSENGAGAPIAPSGETLKNVLESLIFVSGRPVTPKKLARAARATIAEVQPLLDELVADYQHRGVHLYYVARAGTSSVRRVRAPTSSRPLSRPSPCA